MDWHEGLDRAKTHLEPGQIAELVGCQPGDVDAYVNRTREPDDGLARRFDTLGSEIARQEKSDVDAETIAEFWAGDQPAGLLKNDRFDDLHAMVGTQTDRSKQF